MGLEWEAGPIGPLPEPETFSEWRWRWRRWRARHFVELAKAAYGQSPTVANLLALERCQIYLYRVEAARP
jgi:hypothetical protein